MRNFNISLSNRQKRRPQSKSKLHWIKQDTVKRVNMAKHGGSCLEPQIFGRPGVWDQPGQHGETLSLLKIQKWVGCGVHNCNPSCLGGWAMRIAWTQEVEVAVSRDHDTAFQPGWQGETLLKKKRKKKEKYFHSKPCDKTAIVSCLSVVCMDPYP